jgi:hypothetical protein
MLEATVTDELFEPVRSEPMTARGAASFGILPRGDRQVVFAETLRAVILPGLEHFGIDTTGASQWLDERLP